MLNLIDDMYAAAMTHGRDSTSVRCLEIQQEHLEASRRLPWRPLAAALGILYSAAIVVAGCGARLIGRHRPDPLFRRLAARYCQVPEMILHKGIELRSLLKRDLRGIGLDLGCGTGITGEVLIAEGGVEALHGIDVAGLNEATLLSRGYKGYSVGDMQHLPHRDAAFDYLLSICVVEHVLDLDKLLSESARVLRSGGRFYFTTPSPLFRESLIVYRLLRCFGFRRKAERFKEFRDVMAMHYHYLPAEAWRERLAGAGFTDIEIEPIFSRRQLLVYDLMNFQVYFLRLYFYEHLSRWARRSKAYRRLTEWASTELCANVAATPATAGNATHYSIACRKI